MKAAGGSLSRGAACSACRRSFSLASIARNNNGSKLNVATRRPLAVVYGRRQYASAAGVVSNDFYLVDSWGIYD